MKIGECRNLLLNKALQINEPNAQRFVDYIVSHRLPTEIRQYSSASIQQFCSLFCEVMNYLEARPPQFQQLPPLQKPPSWGHGHGLQFPQPSPQPQLHPSSNFPGNQAEVPLLHGQRQFDPRFSFDRIQPPFFPFNPIQPVQRGAQVPLPHGQPQFDPRFSFNRIQPPFSPFSPIEPVHRGAQVPLPHGQPQFDPRFSFNRIQPPFFSFSPIEPVHRDKLQFYPSSSIDGIQPPLLPIGQIGQPLPQIRPSTIFNEIQPPFPPNVHSHAPKGVPPNVHSSAHQNASQSVAGDSSGRSKHCYDHFNGGCKNGKCDYCHWSYLEGMTCEMPNHSLETLPVLGEEIRQLLISQRPSVVPIEHLPMIYFAKYAKSLLVMDFKPEAQQLGEKRWTTVCSLGGDALESSGSAADSKLVLVPPSPSHRVTIYIAFSHQSTFTVRGAWNYFRKFGPVTFLRMLGATRGYVSFLYPETVELLLSETRSNYHLILGAQVHIFSSMEKLEWKVSGQEESDKVSDVNVSFEHHIGEKTSSELEPSPEKLNNECDKVISADKSSSTVAHGMASEGDNAVESSDVSNHLDKASVDQDIDDSGLQDDLSVDWRKFCATSSRANWPCSKQKPEGQDEKHS